VKLSPDGRSILYSTYFGGTAFLAQINPAGSKLTYSALYPSGTVGQSVTVDSSGLVHFAGSAGIISSIAPASPGMTIFDFQNAAGGNVTAQISPAELIAIYGPAIGPFTAATAKPVNGSYPTTLSGVEVAINGVNIPLLYVSSNQISAVAPMELAANMAATIHVTNGTNVSADYAAWIITSTPHAFAPTINQDGTVNSQSNPAHGGSIVTFSATGWQSSFAPLTDGQEATGADDACLEQCQASASYFQLPICVGFCFARPAIGPGITITATVQYGGAAPTLVAGITQFNVQLGTPPASSGTPVFNVSVTSGATGVSVSQGVWIAH
jgi:uncharacterized protein (TIGR03437 family)